ncbi:glycosyltransferase [Patescibacteria group bacterium]
MKVSILIVQFGDAKPTIACIKSIYKSSIDKKDFEIIIVDNNRNDEQKEVFKRKFPKSIYVKSKKNNYCHALNVGVKKAKGEFVHVLNPDTLLDKNCISELLRTFEKDKRIAGVTSKILFNKSKRINSLGIEEIGDHYYRDTGFDEEDSEDLRVSSIKYASGCSVMYRKKALEDVGYFDEDFVMYMEDVNMGIELRKKKWTLKVNPKSIIYHAFHGTAKGVDLPSYFCNRNRFILMAKHYPQDFAKNIKTSAYYIHKNHDDLFDFIRAGIYKLMKDQPENVIKKYLPKILEVTSDIYPFDKVQNILNEIELVFGLRKPKILLYDHALHFIGGGQKYGCTIAEALQKKYYVLFIGNKKVDIPQLEKWYDLNLKKCNVKIVPLKINKKDELINPSLAEDARVNPFAPVEDNVWKHDIFINVNMTPHVNALALYSIFLCHFPDGKKRNFFYPQEYDTIVANSKYTNGWLEKKWKLKADKVIYPPIDMAHKKSVKKENIILSVGRFEESGSKKQYELAEAFSEICKKNKKIANEWKLILAGGTIQKNPYLKKIQRFVKSNSCNIEIQTNVENEDLKQLYANAKIFWHACGLNQHKKKNPHLIEHFGMSTVEAMQNGCAPIVINGGGQREIIDHKKNGFRFNSEKDLKKITLKLIKNENLLRNIQKNAKNDSKKYEKHIFQNHFLKIIDPMVEKLKDPKRFIPEAHEVYKKLVENSD